MAGACKIDNVDISTLGMLIVKGGDDEFLTFPERKEPTKNSWFEYDGVEVDLSEVYFRERKMTVKFHISAQDTVAFENRLDALYNLLAAPGYRSVYVREFAKTFTLRYLSCTQFTQRGRLSVPGLKSADLSVQFSMDSPLQIFSAHTVPENTPETQPATHVSINGTDLSLFGVIVEKMYHTALQLPATKPVLTRTFDRSTGLIADTAAPPHKDFSDIAVACTMRAATRETFYANYSALFSRLTVPGALNMAIPGRAFPCYYAKMDSFRKRNPFSHGVSVAFKITFKRI